MCFLKPQTCARPCSSTSSEYMCCLPLISKNKMCKRKWGWRIIRMQGCEVKFSLQKEGSKSAIVRNVSYKYKITPKGPWEPIRCSESTICRSEPGLIYSRAPNMQIRRLEEGQNAKSCQLHQQLQFYDSGRTFTCSPCFFIQMHLKYRHFCPLSAHR